MRNRLRPYGSTGGALIELCIVLPALFLLIAALLDFSFGVSDRGTEVFIASELSRLGAAYDGTEERSPGVIKNSCELVCDKAQDLLCEYHLNPVDYSVVPVASFPEGELPSITVNITHSTIPYFSGVSLFSTPATNTFLLEPRAKSILIADEALTCGDACTMSECA